MKTENKSQTPRKNSESTNQSKNNQDTKNNPIKQAVDTGWASIEFHPDGTIQDANENFTSALGYGSSEEFIGKHHKVFCDDDYVTSSEYKQFWNELAEGHIKSGEFKRRTKDGEEIWINASYTPIKDDQGKVKKVIKIAADITEMVNNRLNADGVQNAVDTGWAMIEFHPDGTIINANGNFVEGLGYTSLEDIKGEHHRIFCESDYANSFEYKQFWKNLANGKVQSGEFKRFRRDGSEIWINASYTPVFDKNGNVIKVIKIAADITEMVQKRMRGDAIQAAVDTGWAMIEFQPDGTILNANENFVNGLAYNSVDEIKNHHHRMFCDPDYANSEEYKQFWQSLANGEVKSGEFKRFKKNGEELWINASYTPIKNPNGEVIKVIKIATDITDQKTVIKNVQEIVNQASENGDLSARVDTSTAKGDYLILSDTVNKLMNAVANPINEMKSLIIDLSEGNLTRSFESEVHGDFKEMADAYNTARSNLSQLIDNINRLANLVASSAEEMTVKGEQMKDSTKEMNSAIQQMATGVQDQAQQIDQTNGLIENVLKTAKESAKKAEVINSSAEQGQQNSQEGMVTINDVVTNMGDIQSSAGETFESINVLSERSEEIARTLNVITDIASQTNLLALNAAIEAARAGEAGRGFAVVAEEIRKLAEDSRKSAQNIETVINEVQKDINQASKSIDVMEESVKSGNESSKKGEAVFQKIDQANAETLDLSKDILEAAADQETAIDGVVRNIEKIVVVSEETAAGTEQIAASSQELSQGMDEVSSTSRELSEVANELQQGVSKFKL